MTIWCAVIICFMIISSSSGHRFRRRGYRGFENEQYQGYNHIGMDQGVKWSRTKITPDLTGIVHQCLGQVRYDPLNIELQDIRQRMCSDGIIYRVGFTNSELNHNCIVQFVYNNGNIISVRKPSCSGPCPGQVCVVDKKLRSLDNWYKSHKKSWQDRKYNEEDYEGHTIDNKADIYNKR